MNRAYLDPALFLEHWKVSREINECTKELLSDFQKLAENLTKAVVKNIDEIDARTYTNYALSCAWEKWDKYDMSKNTSIFSFFTEMMKNDMIYHYNYVNRLGNRCVSIDQFFSHS